MARFHIKSRPTSRFTLHLEDDPFEIEIAKLSITDLLVLEREGKRIMAAIAASDQALPPESHTQLLDFMARLILRTYGLTDEEGQEIVWAELPQDQQREILSFVRVDDLFEVFSKVGKVGRLKEHEKKV